MTLRPCFVINTMNKGGAERFVIDLSERLSSTYDVQPIIVAICGKGESKNDIDYDLVKYINLDTKPVPHSIPSGTLRLKSFVESEDIDLIHTHLTYSNIVGRIVCKLTRIPHVTTYHNVWQHKPRLRQVAERLSMSGSDELICVSEGVKKTFPNKPDIQVIYNAIDAEVFEATVKKAKPADISDADRGDYILLNVARCVEQKKQSDLIKAIGKLDREDVHLIIVGGGPLKENLEQIVEKNGLSGMVTIEGFVDDIEPYYAAADAFISASSREGLPSTHIEAMIAELPIISTEIPGVEELVEQGRNGYLAPVGNTSQLANCIQQILDSSQLGRNGKKIAYDRFTIGAVAEEHMKIYDKLHI